jgi:ubiquinone/menaquinone biosynthesis C-methylase UbiE
MKHEEYERMYRFEDRYWWFVARRHLIVTLLETYYPRTGQLRILDIGCGTGAMLDELRPFGDVVGADFSPEALQFCVTRGAPAEAPPLKLARADVRRLPFADSAFDVVTAMDIIEHIDDDKAAASEIFRVLKPGGRLLVTVPAFSSLWSEHDEALHHFRRYTAPHLKDVFQRVGLSVSKLSYTVTTLFAPIWVYRQVSNLFSRKLFSPKLLSGEQAGGEKKANLVNFSGPVNQALLSLSQWETRLVQSWNLPFGVSVVCVAHKPEAAETVQNASADQKASEK